MQKAGFLTTRLILLQDTQWDDIDYMRSHLDWTYDSSGQFAGLPAVVDDLHAKGQHYIMIIVSYNIGIRVQAGP